MDGKPHSPVTNIPAKDILSFARRRLEDCGVPVDDARIDGMLAALERGEEVDLNSLPARQPGAPRTPADEAPP